MGWCRTHNRIVTGEWTSCSVKASDRGDCVPVWWGKCNCAVCRSTETDLALERRDDWTEIVNRAYREGRIGHKGLKTADLNAILFSSIYDPRRIGAAQGTYQYSN
jgi:hypothetical protein